MENSTEKDTIKIDKSDDEIGISRETIDQDPVVTSCRNRLAELDNSL